MKRLRLPRSGGSCGWYVVIVSKHLDEYLSRDGVIENNCRNGWFLTYEGANKARKEYIINETQNERFKNG